MHLKSQPPFNIEINCWNLLPFCITAPKAFLLCEMHVVVTIIYVILSPMYYKQIVCFANDFVVANVISVC